MRHKYCIKASQKNWGKKQKKHFVECRQALGKGSLSSASYIALKNPPDPYSSNPREPPPQPHAPHLAPTPRRQTNHAATAARQPSTTVPRAPAAPATATSHRRPMATTVTASCTQPLLPDAHGQRGHAPSALRPLSM